MACSGDPFTGPEPEALSGHDVLVPFHRLCLQIQSPDALSRSCS